MKPPNTNLISSVLINYFHLQISHYYSKCEQISIIQMSVYFYGYEDQFQPKQINYQKTETIKQLFQRVIETQQFTDELGFQIDADDAIIVLKNDNTQLVNLHERVEEVVQRFKQNPLEMTVICPKEQGGILIQYVLNNKHCYFETYVNKNDQLSTFIASLSKRIRFEKKYELKVNGQKDKSAVPFEKRTIKQIIGSSTSQKIKVEINEVEKAEPSDKPMNGVKQKQKQEVRVSDRVRMNGKVENLKQNSIKPKQEEYQEEYNIESQPNFFQSKVQQPFLKRNPEVKQSSLLFEHEAQMIAVEPKKQAKTDHLVHKLIFTIQFETNMGLRSQTHQVDRTKTMIEVLPELLKVLVEAGFDWDINWKHLNDYHDKLAIFYGQQQYKKYEARFMSVLNTSSKPTHDFQFKRVYQGG